ncbi:MAG: DNA repair protein RecO [Elusimicrobia bacterium]|nr:DNA repair protein RecO [Elusimicrobiota bacterium]
MISNTMGVVLSRQNWGEADKLVTLYTEEFGKLRARCVGVNKPGRKMKALCEPFILAEFRLHTGYRTDVAKIIGGQLVSSFPLVRSDYRRMLTAFSFCEMMSQASSERVPNPDKYELIVSALRALEGGVSPWMMPVYGLKLLQLTGQGPAESFAMDGDLRARLDAARMESLDALPYPSPLAGELESAVAERLEDYAGRRLRCPDALRQWHAEAAAC